MQDTAAKDSPMIAAIHSFLDAARGPAAPEITALSKALDSLAAAYHMTPAGAASDSDVDPPEADYNEVRSRIAPRFPMLGLYAVSDPLTLTGERMVGDAIDDIADIALVLTETLWRWDNLGFDDAYWHFRSTYQIHWGRHLHELRSCLHAVLFYK
jgi:hypothetical protein